MKVIFFGLGSIGTRHLKNLRTLFNNRDVDLEVHAFRSKKKSKAEVVGVKNIYDLASLDSDYDIAFVTNPTALHLETLELLKGRASWFFVEKPLFERTYPFEYGISNHYYIAAPLRYKKTMAAAKELISQNTIHHARIICSSYLPHWRNEDYRQSYSASEELGGGIEIDCIHELDYVTYLFGLPEKAVSMIGKVSNLEINANDSANYLLKYEKMFAEIHVDYFGKVSQRTLQVITEDDTFEFDFYKNTRTMLSTGAVTVYNEEANDMYISEMTYFLDEVMNGRSNHNDFEHAAAVLAIAKGD